MKRITANLHSISVYIIWGRGHPRLLLNFKLLILITAMVYLISCRISDKKLYEFDPRNLKEDRITLSDITDDVTYVPLENNITLGPVYSYKIIDDYIYLSVKDEGILVFNNKGNFIMRVGNPGRGPGEYYYFMNFDVNPESRTVFILDHQQIKVYDYNGDFQRVIDLRNFNSLSFEDISYFGNNLLLSDYIERGDAKYSWLILDTIGSPLSWKLNPIPPFRTTLPSGGGNYLFEEKVHYWELYNDTVFAISPDLKIEPSFSFKTGDHRWPKSMIQISPDESFRSYLLNHFNITLIIETNRFIILKYTFKKVSLALIEKSNRKIYLTYFKTNQGNPGISGGIYNNIDGGPDFQPQFYYTEKGREYLTQLLFPYQLKASINSLNFANTNVNVSGKREDLKKLANSLKETDNPVLMIVRLKE